MIDWDDKYEPPTCYDMHENLSDPPEEIYESDRDVSDNIIDIQDDIHDAFDDIVGPVVETITVSREDDDEDGNPVYTVSDSYCWDD